jgi:hypothetical protein
MNTHTVANENLNMSANERGFRALLGLGMIVAILMGAVTTPAAIFALSMACIYLAMTTISGIDLSYNLVDRMTRRLSPAMNTVN